MAPHLRLTCRCSEAPELPASNTPFLLTTMRPAGAGVQRVAAQAPETARGKWGSARVGSELPDRLVPTLHACTRTHMHSHVCTYIHTHTRTRACHTNTCARVHIYTLTHVTHTHKSPHTFTHIHTLTCAHTGARSFHSEEEGERQRRTRERKGSQPPETPQTPDTRGQSDQSQGNF